MWGSKKEEEKMKAHSQDAEAPPVPRHAPAIPSQDEADQRLKHPQPHVESPSVPRPEQGESSDTALKRRSSGGKRTSGGRSSAAPPSSAPPATTTTTTTGRTPRRNNRDDSKAGHQDIQNDIQEARAAASRRTGRGGRGSATASTGGDSASSSGGMETRLTSLAAREKGVTGDDGTPGAVGAYQVARRAPGQMPQWARPHLLIDEEQPQLADPRESVAEPPSLLDGDTVSSLGGTSQMFHQSGSSLGSSFQDETTWVDASVTNLIMPQTIMEEEPDNKKKLFFLRMKLICALITIILLLSLIGLIMSGELEFNVTHLDDPLNTKSVETTIPTILFEHCDTNGTFLLDSPEDMARSIRYSELRFLMELEWEEDSSAVFDGALCGPHDLALTWLADVDLMQLNIISLEDNNRMVRQRLAMAILFFFTDMPIRFLKHLWMNPTSECLWQGILCNTDGYVTKIELSNFDLAGPIPELLFPLLPSLLTLDLSKNKLTGTIPLSIHSSSSLGHVYLGHNILTGTFPTTLASLTNLKNLHISENHFTGTIPTAMASLTNLNELMCGSNELTGTLPEEIFNLPNLKNITLAHNRLRGYLPEVMSSTLQGIDCSRNRLTGTLPEVLYSLTNLEILDLHENILTGSLSSQVTNLVNLAVFDLCRNQLGRSLPKELLTLSSLQICVLSDNFLTGTLFSGIERMVNLEWLELGNNLLSGPLPSGMGELTFLETLILDNNDFIGNIPESLGRLSHLDFMQLNRNNLVGSVPDSLCGRGGVQEYFVDPDIHCSCCVV